MKDKQVACFLLIVVSLLLGYLAQMSYGKLVEARRAADEAKQAAIGAQQAYSMAKAQMEKLKESTSSLRDFFVAWEPHIRATQSPQATEQRIIDLVKQAGIFTVSQRFELLDEREEPLLRNRLRAHITVEDEYSKALNWMADVEEALPTCRVSSCRIARGESGNDLRMELILDIPIVNIHNL